MPDLWWLQLAHGIESWCRHRSIATHARLLSYQPNSNGPLVPPISMGPCTSIPRPCTHPTMIFNNVYSFIGKYLLALQRGGPIECIIQWEKDSRKSRRFPDLSPAKTSQKSPLELCPNIPMNMAIPKQPQKSPQHIPRHAHKVSQILIAIPGYSQDFSNYNWNRWFSKFHISPDIHKLFPCSWVCLKIGYLTFEYICHSLSSR